MAFGSPKGSVSAGDGKDWESLSPAIAPTGAVDRVNSAEVSTTRERTSVAADADRFLDARRRGQGAEQATELNASVEAGEPVTVAERRGDSSSVDAGAEGQVLSPKPVAVKSIVDEEEEAARRASAREAAMADRPRWLRLRAVLIAVAVPMLTFALAVRAVATSAFLWVAYHRPGFPEDAYGFSTDDRMRFGSYGMEYVVNFAPESYLSGLRTEQGSRLFLQSEVQHMTDVKHVMIAVMCAATVMLLLALLASRTLATRAPGTIRRSLFGGSMSTLVLMVALGVVAALGWESSFTNFHQLFFPQGNWQFRMSDTLIRLYPPQFWVDAAITVAFVVFALTVLLLVFTWPTAYRKAKAEHRAEERLALRQRLSR